MIDEIRAQSLAIPFRQSFKHAAAARAATQSIWVTVSGCGASGYGEGCPRDYVTGESTGSAQAFIAAHADAWRNRIGDVAGLEDWVRTHRREIDANPAAWTAVELAMLDLLGKLNGVSVEGLLGLSAPRGRFQYAAVLGDAPTDEFALQLARYRDAGFRHYKIKLGGDFERDIGKVEALRAANVPADFVRADANNLWEDHENAARAITALRFRFCALEEPLRKGDYSGMRSLAEALDSRIILDESMARPQQLDRLPGTSGRWLVNLRVSKMGGLLRSLEFLQAARSKGIGIIVGAHVGETSVLTRVGLTVAAAAGDFLVSQEGAFGTHLLQRDVVDEPLMFGAGGIVDVDELSLGEAPGWGLSIVDVAK
jgi:L-Ala-D/L-Glu epimerase